MSSSDPRGSESSRHKLIPGLVGSLVVTIGLGWVGLFGWYEMLPHWSFDLPFLWRSNTTRDDIVIVYMDAGSGRLFGQAPGAAWDRRLQARLIDRLTEAGARLVVYDIMFLSPGREPAADEELAAAIRRNGRVILAGGERSLLTGAGDPNRIGADLPLPPYAPFREAALAWGSAKVRGRGTGSFVRQFSEPDLENAPDILPLSFAAAKELGVDAGVMAPSPTAVRWINFAGPPGVWKSWLFAQALTTATSGLRDKVVFVGALPERGFLDMDQYATPYVHGGRRDVRGQASLTPGVEFHATMLANLLDKAWLRRASSTNQAVAVVLIGLLLTPGVLLLNPWRSAGFCLAIAGGITMSSFLLPWRCFIWWSWLVPVAVQIPAGYIWGVGYRYFVLEATRRRMKRAFSAYLSPVMAEQISIRDDLLELGGQEVDATVMFTDLENFTNMSEGLPPSEVSRILITYFNRTTRAILEEDGTIIKYIGDAVMAVWGAPLPDSRMADRAVRAAWGMIVAGRQEIEGRQLRTRIGVHTGMVLAGNLGSDFRFDYTLIGDTTNLASRLEGLNKHLGTQLLISDATFKRLTIPMVSRPLGRFRVVGRKDPVILHEILGLGIAEPITALLLKQYAAALALFDAARFVEARTAFAKAAQMRAGSDGPSNFFLAEVERRLREETTSDTDTVVAILSK